MAKDLFKVGEAILVTIRMTDSSTEPRNVCLSANLYQNVPVLTKGGKPVVIMECNPTRPASLWCLNSAAAGVERSGAQRN